MESDDEGEAAITIGSVNPSSALNASLEGPCDTCVIDSGCTHYMTSRKDWFINFEEKVTSRILLGDFHTVETSGVGSIRLNTHGGTVKIMHNVRYVPNLIRNLMSTHTLDKLGFTHSRGNGKITFHKNNQVAFRGTIKNGLYILDGEIVTGEVRHAEKAKSQASLWHSRLGHMSYKNLQVLVRDGVLKKNEVDKDEFCEHCIMGKVKKVSFEAGKHETC